MGVVLELQSSGKVSKKSKTARQVCLYSEYCTSSDLPVWQKGTTILLTNPFLPLPVRRKEFERNAKREFGKALALLSAYALGPCCAAQPVRLTVSNQIDKGYVKVSAPFIQTIHLARSLCNSEHMVYRLLAHL